PPELPPPAPPLLRRLVARLLEKDPARRPQRADEVAAALAPPRRRVVVWLGALATAILVAAVAALVLRPGRPSQARVGALPMSDENAEMPTFSPDGKLILYTSDRDDRGPMMAYVMPVAGGPPRAISPRDLWLWHARWQRDGRAALLMAHG